MAIKYICDICEQEIPEKEQNNGKLTVNELAVIYEKHKPMNQITTTEYLFCGVCALKVRDYAKSLCKPKTLKEQK